LAPEDDKMKYYMKQIRLTIALGEINSLTAYNIYSIFTNSKDQLQPYKNIY